MRLASFYKKNKQIVGRNDTAVLIVADSQIIVPATDMMSSH